MHRERVFHTTVVLPDGKVASSAASSSALQFKARPSKRRIDTVWYTLTTLFCYNSVKVLLQGRDHDR
jgi:hypothetical protein